MVVVPEAERIGTSADLVTLVAAETASTAGGLVDALTARLGEPADDVTLLVLRREESA